jgi:hypothetical protein
MRPRFSMPLLMILTAIASLNSVLPADAGCGCAKAPPIPAPVRPNVAYPGAPITFFGDFQDGTRYTVTFTSGVSGEAGSVSGQAIRRRDLADGIVKPQLEVPLPAVALGRCASASRPTARPRRCS